MVVIATVLILIRLLIEVVRECTHTHTHSQKGQVLPTEPRFDSNCITPGTDFMTRLHEHLKYFVAKKISSDPTWQKVRAWYTSLLN